jgi:hypothetical protein
MTRYQQNYSAVVHRVHLGGECVGEVDKGDCIKQRRARLKSEGAQS